MKFKVGDRVRIKGHKENVIGRVICNDAKDIGPIIVLLERTNDEVNKGVDPIFITTEEFLIRYVKTTRVKFLCWYVNGKLEWYGCGVTPMSAAAKDTSGWSIYRVPSGDVGYDLELEKPRPEDYEG